LTITSETSPMALTLADRQDYDQALIKLKKDSP